MQKLLWFEKFEGVPGNTFDRFDYIFLLTLDENGHFLNFAVGGLFTYTKSQYLYLQKKIGKYNSTKEMFYKKHQSLVAFHFFFVKKGFLVVVGRKGFTWKEMCIVYIVKQHLILRNNLHGYTRNKQYFRCILTRSL